MVSFDLNDFQSKTVKKTVTKHHEEIKNIYIYNNRWDDIIEIIKSRYKDNEKMYILNVESIYSMESSMILALEGYYKESRAILRMWFENSIYGIYFQDHPIEFDRWSFIDDRKAFKMNFSKDLLDYLFIFDNFKKFDDKFKKIYKETSFRKLIVDSYNELSAYIHGRGFHRSNLENTIDGDKITNYNKESFISWYNLFIHVFHILIISFLLYDPKLLNRHNKKRKEILKCLDDIDINILKDEINIKI